MQLTNDEIEELELSVLESSEYKDDEDGICRREFYAYGEYGSDDTKQLDCDGGGEGGSEYCYCIFSHKGVHYKAEFGYYSYHGYDFDDLTVTIVKPVEKVVTVYE